MQKEFTLSESQIIDSNGFRQIQGFLTGHDVQIYLAGGVIRNFFANKQTGGFKDIDLFYTGELAPLLKELKETGKLIRGPFGAFRWYSYEPEVPYIDLISIRDFKPVSTCHTIQDVLNQFDFTVNGFAYSLNDSSFFSLTNAFEDLEKKLIRMVRFDYLDKEVSPEIDLSRLSVLWFRLLHYSELLNFVLEDQTRDWIRENKSFLKDRERFEYFFFKPSISYESLSQLNII